MNIQNQYCNQPNPPSHPTEYELLSPNGCRIRGTLDRIDAVKGIFRIKPDPEQGFSYEPDFERTDVLWDTQNTVKNCDGETLFIDEGGRTWAASEVKIRAVSAAQ